MNVSLTRELEKFVVHKVRSGLYQTASEVVREGLRLLRERDQLGRDKLQQLRDAIAVGLAQADSGQTAPFTEKTLARAKSRAPGKIKRGRRS